MAKLLILGACSDIAQAVARKYASENYDLVLAARNIQRLETLKKDLQIRYQVQIELKEFDVLDSASHCAFYQSVNKDLTGVISVIGYLGNQDLAGESVKEHQLITDTNYTQLAAFLNLVALDFEEKKSGFIIGVSSVAGDRGRASNYHYGAAKAAFSSYLSGLRNRLFKSNVHVMTVKPGFVDTQMTKGMDLPAKLTASPQQVAKEIFNAQVKRKNVIYTRWYWRWIMLVIKLIPEFVFKRLNL
jgi:decaprenylphospho-beta-D-erythro-pentofuranosid-2-ulose 2-reductase